MKTKIGFTLIELLVVITIIGILAVGGIQVYTSQIKKARDSTRIKDIMALHMGFEQYFLDNGKVYERIALETGPNIVIRLRDTLKTYNPNINNFEDPKDACKNAGCLNAQKSCKGFDLSGNIQNWFCGYLYRPHTSGNTYELSAAFESESNICNSPNNCNSTKDGGNSNDRFEVGSNLAITTEMIEITGGKAGISSTLDVGGGGGYVYLTTNMP